MNNQKQTISLILRMFGGGLLIALLIATGVALYGWLRGWQTATEYSNGMFISGSIVIILGVLAVAGGFTSRGNFGITYSQSAGDASIPDRTRQMIVDLLRGYNALAVSAVSGSALIGLSILIYNIFG